MSDKFLLSIFVVLFIISALTLSFIEHKQSDLDYQKNWWALYFIDPHNDNLDFTIENHSDATRFHYTVTQDKEMIAESTVDIPKGQSETITIEKKFGGSGRFTVAAWTNEKDGKQIYK